MIVENPYAQPHYLTTYFPIKPKIIDKDRTKNGDTFQKPTQYWFVNCDPQRNLVFEPITCKRREAIEHTGDRVKRSMISSEYASRFIRQFILDGQDDQEKSDSIEYRDEMMQGQFSFDMDGNITEYEA